MWNVFTPLPSKSARLLAQVMEGRRLKRLRGFTPQDRVINWGSINHPLPEGTFNRNVIGDKFLELALLADAGIPVPPHSTEPQEGWFARSLHHREGTDFLPQPQLQGAYYVERVPTTREFRFHVFNFGGDDQRILRWGEKLARNAQAHPWVRSWNNGWRLSYGAQDLPRGLRPVAKAALKALGYSFGAVDLGLTNAGTPVIFEVNSAPGLDEGGKTVVKYAEAFKEAVGDGNNTV